MPSFFTPVGHYAPTSGGGMEHLYSCTTLQLIIWWKMVEDRKKWRKNDHHTADYMKKWSKTERNEGKTTTIQLIIWRKLSETERNEGKTTIKWSANRLNEIYIDTIMGGGCVLKYIFFKNYYCSFSCDANFSCIYEPHPVVTPFLFIITLTNVSSFWNMLPWGEGALCQPYSWLYEENGRKQKEMKDKRPLNDLLIDRLKFICTIMGGWMFWNRFPSKINVAISSHNFSCDTHSLSCRPFFV